MSVELTSPAGGLNRGDTYTGPLEAWLIAEGYATSDRTMPVTKAASDPRLAEHRERPGDSLAFKGKELKVQQPGPAAVLLPDGDTIVGGS